jgi:DNA glycosylase AlkZ-like
MFQDTPKVRLQNQMLTSHQYEKPEEVVSWFGAMQAQDFAAAKWALALRTKNQTVTDIEQAFNEGKILRTHIMRPTWHFVTPSDIRWLLALTAERIHRFNGHYYRQSGLNKTIFKKSNEVIHKALSNGKQLTRNELNEYLTAAQVPTENLGLSYTIMQAELEGIIISGPRRGKQFTYMLLDERVPKSKTKTNDEALAELTKRYFQSHGPAQLQDFSWWSGLTTTDAKRGIEIMQTKLAQETINGKQYWFINSDQKVKHTNISNLLLPNFDEYIVGYTDRSAIYDKSHDHKLDARGNAFFQHTIVSNGRIIGTWKRTIKAKTLVVTLTVFEKISEEQQNLLAKQAERFGKFLNLPVIINMP